MHAFFLISCFAFIGVLAVPEPPISYLGRHRSSISNSLFGIRHQVPSGRYGTLDHSADSYNAAYRQSSIQHETGYEYPSTETEIHKHVYVHVPPQEFEDEEMTPRVTHQVAPKQKHYKIVFIKSPSAPKVLAPIVPPTPQNEEKTLIYVLHKKPQAQPDIVIPTPVPTTPSKPEVYFIKYKTKKNEAPVYGPPPKAYKIQARSDVSTSNDYATPVSNDLNGLNDKDNQLDVQGTTSAPVFIDEAITPEIAETLAASAIGNETNEPNNQYLPTQTTMAPIVVAEIEEQAQVPIATYGAPKRYFIKRRK